MYGVGLQELLEDRRLNARLATGIILALTLLGVLTAISRPFSGIAIFGAAILSALPGPFYRSHAVTLPWELLSVVAGAALWLAWAPNRLSAYAFLAAIVLVLVFELDLFTPLRMSHRFAVALVPIFTAAIAGLGAVVRWLLLTGGSVVPEVFLISSHTAILLEFVAATIAGVIAGIGFEIYVVHWEGRLDFLTPAFGGTDRMGNGETSSRDREHTPKGSRQEGVARLIKRIERRYRPVRFVQGIAALALIAGLLRQDVDLTLNAALGLTVTVVPGVVERSGPVTISPALGLWVGLAVVLHVLGTIQLPALGVLYETIPWYDHLTHAASASLVAAAGYGVIRAVDDHTDAIELTPVFAAGITLATVLAVGVYWEVLEFGVGRIGIGGALEQHGLMDTMNDLVFDTAGGLVAAAWGAFRSRSPVAIRH